MAHFTVIADSFGTNGSQLFSTNGSRVLELAAHVCSAAGESKANESRFRSSAAGRCGDLVAVLAVKEANSSVGVLFSGERKNGTMCLVSQG